MTLPIVAETKAESESRLGIPIKWEYEPRKRLPGIRSHFNHDGRWIGLTVGGFSASHSSTINRSPDLGYPFCYPHAGNLGKTRCFL